MSLVTVKGRFSGGGGRNWFPDLKGRNARMHGTCQELESRRLLATVSGDVFNDADDDGVRDVGESALTGWTVYADYDRDGVLDQGEPSTTTNATGNYSFWINHGHHYIRLIPASGWRITYPVGDFHQVDGNVHTGGKHFGATQRGSIAGTVFDDRNGNGVKGSAEGGLSGRTVFIDADDDGVKDVGESSTTTDSQGNYTLRNLSTGVAHAVRTVAPSGWTRTGTTFEYVTLGSGEAKTGVRFGHRRALAAPSELTATTISSTQVELAWNDFSLSEQGFKIEMSTNGGAFTQVASVAAGSSLTYTHTVGSLDTVNNDYVFRVAAYNADGNSYWSDPANPDAPDAVEDLVSEAQTGSVTLSWTAPSGAASYNIYRTIGPDALLGTPIASGVTSTTYTDNTVTNGTEYYYHVEPAAARKDPVYPFPIGPGRRVIAIPPPQANVLVRTASFALANGAIATSDPNDNFDTYESLELGPLPVGVSKYHNCSKLISASAKLYWFMDFMYEAEPDDPNNVTFEVGHSGTWENASETPPNGPTPGGPIDSVSGPTQAEPLSGSLHAEGIMASAPLDDPPCGLGLNEIEIFSRAWACATSVNKASIGGFFSGFYSVTYHINP